MTREEIIDFCEMKSQLEPENEDIFNNIIKALEQEPCEDCLDRNHVIATISQHHFDKDKDNFDLLIHNLCKEVNDLPPVTPQPQTGYWEWMTEDKYRCSNCNYETRVDECMNKPMYDFCPFCGAKMVQESEEV